MELLIIGSLAVLLAALGIAVYLVVRRLDERKSPDSNDALLLLQNQVQSQMAELSRVMHDRLGELPKIMQGQFGESARIVREVTEKLAKLDETNRQVVNFADQLKNLQDVLKNPKQRGILGEYYLETLLKNVFAPGMYQMQYAFKDGTIVDAVVFVKDRIIPIDSKFSLENYNRIVAETDPVEREKLERVFKQDLKNRIDETAKYVRPEERTMDFAFMFIPAEGIYYDLLVNQVGAVKTNTRDLIEYAFIEKKVHIVSPTTFLSHLKMVLHGLRALQIEESAKEIGKRVEELGRHLGSYEEYMKKLGGHLGTSVSMYNQAYRELGKIDKDVLRITGAGVGVEPVALEKPTTDREEG